MDNSALLQLFTIINPNLAIGGFAYSQGIEAAVEYKFVTNSESAFQWISNQLSGSLATTDLPVLLKLYTHINDYSKVAYWSAVLLAARETHELRQEEIHRARAFFSILDTIDDAITVKYKTLEDKNQILAYALAGAFWKINLNQLLTGYSWSWLENQVASAVKIIPLGQHQGQRLLQQLLPGVAEAIETAQAISDDMIGQSQMNFAIVSSLHETQWTRIFRS